MIREHYEAMHDRLESHEALAGKVDDTLRYDEDGKYRRENYIVLLGGAPVAMGGERQARKLTANDNAVFDWALRHVGISPDAVRLLMEASAAQLAGWVPTIVGRRCSAMHYPPNQNPEIRPENSVKPPLFYADVEWVLRSHFVNSDS